MNSYTVLLTPFINRNNFPLTQCMPVYLFRGYQKFSRLTPFALLLLPESTGDHPTVCVQRQGTVPLMKNFVCSTRFDLHGLLKDNSLVIHPKMWNIYFINELLEANKVGEAVINPFRSVQLNFGPYIIGISLEKVNCSLIKELGAPQLLKNSWENSHVHPWVLTGSSDSKYLTCYRVVKF
jgi:hypothetical protein